MSFWFCTKDQNRSSKAAMNKAKLPGWELTHDPLEIKLSKDHKIISQRPRHYFDKWTLSLSLAGHTRQIHIIIRRNHWLTVHRHTHWSNGTKQQLRLLVTNCHPGDLPLGIHSPEGETLSNIWHSTFLPWHIHTMWQFAWATAVYNQDQ